MAAFCNDTDKMLSVGLAGSGLAAVFVGTASLPFLIFACAGFIFGSVGFYRNTLSRSLIALDRNPRLMQLHLDANYPDRGFLRFSDRQLRSEEFGRSWILQSMLVCSWLTAQPALDVSSAHPSSSALEVETDANVATT